MAETPTLRFKHLRGRASNQGNEAVSSDDERQSIELEPLTGGNGQPTPRADSAGAASFPAWVLPAFWPGQRRWCTLLLR